METALSGRLVEKEAEMNEVERKLQGVIDKIDASNRRLPRRPGVSGDQLRAEVKRIDTKLTTTSMKLVEEKSLLRKKDVIKARLKELAGFETSMQEILALKEQRRALIAEKRDMAAQVAEMQRGLRRLGLAGRLGVAARDLAQESIEVPHEAIGRVIGKKRAALTQLEQECNLSITEEVVRFEPGTPTRQHGASTTGSNAVASGGGGSGNSGGGDSLILNLCGTRDGVAEARRRLDLTIRTTEAIVEASLPLAAALKASKRALLIRLEKELGVDIFVGSSIFVAKRDAGGGGGGGGSGADDARLGQGIEAGGGVGGVSARGQGPCGGKGDGGVWTTVSALEVILRGVPEDISMARSQLAEYERNCVEVVVPVERRALQTIYGPGGTNVQQMESQYSVYIEVQPNGNKVVLRGVRKDVEAAAEKIREISHAFRTTEEKFEVQPYQVKFLRHNRHAELNAISQRLGVGMSIVAVSVDSDKSSDKAKPPATAADPAAAATATTAASAGAAVLEPPAGQGRGGVTPDGSLPDCSTVKQTHGQQRGFVAENQGAGLVSYVVMRGTVPMVVRARAMLGERLRVAERLVAKLPISGEAVATFVGHGGSAIRKLRHLCVGCSVDLSPVGPEGRAEVSLMAEDETRLGVARGLVEKWIRQQQLRVVPVGSDMAGMLRTFRAAGVREKIIGAGRRQDGAGAGGGGGDELFWGVHMDSLVEEGVVRLRGREEELDRAERLIREFQAENWTTEVPVALDDEDVLVRRGLLRDTQAKESDAHFQYLRDRRVVVVRGRREVAERAARLLQATVHGGGLDRHGAALLRASLVPLAPSGMKHLMARGRFHLKRLSKDTGADLDVVPSASVVRVRARRPDTAAAVVADAKRALLRVVGSHQAEVLMDLAAVGSPSRSPTTTSPSPASLASGGGGRSGVKRKAGARGAMQAVMGSDDSGDEGEGGGGSSGVGVGGGGGGGGGAAAVAMKAVGPPNRSVSNESVRRTVRLHGCEVEFVAAPPSTSGRGGGGSGGSGSSESGAKGANGNRDGGAASSSGGAGKQQRQAANHNNARHQDAGRGGGAGAAAAAAASASVQPAATGVVTAPRNTQSRGVSIRGPPGLVENARNALVALVLGREESEISLRAGVAATLGSGNWRKIQESSNDVSISPDSSRSTLRVSGPPAAVEVCRKELYAMLGAVFRGQFHVVPIPREALHEVATPLVLADAAATAAAASPGSDRRAAAVAETAEVLGPVGAAAAAAGWIGEWNVQLSADWACSCVRVRGDAAAVRVAVEAVHAALSKWSALEVTAEVDHWMVHALFGKQGKAIKKLSRSMGGIVLRVNDGICRGRATSVEAAREATRKLEERVSEIRARQAVVRVPAEAASKLEARGGSSIEKLRERTRATIEIKKGGRGENAIVEVTISGDPNAVAAAKREVEALSRTKTEHAAKVHQKEQDTRSSAPRPRSTASAEPSPCSLALPSTPPGGRPSTVPPPPLQAQQRASNEATTACATNDAAREPGCDATAKIDKAADVAVTADTDGVGGDRSFAEDRTQIIAQEPPPAQSTVTAAGDARKVRQRPGSTIAPSPEHLYPCNARGMSVGATTTTAAGTKIEPICFGTFETKSDDRTGSGEPKSKAGRDPATFGTAQNNAAAATAAKRSPLSHRGRGGGGDRNKRVSAATESEAERLLASLLLVDNATAAAAGFPRSSHRQPEAFPVASTKGSSGLRSVTRDGENPHGREHHHHRNASHSLRPPSVPTGPSLSLPSPPPSSGFHRNSAGSCAAGFSSPCNAVPPPSLPPRGEAAPPAGGAGYFASSSGVRVRL